MKEEVSVSLITKTSDLPDIICDDFFHSVDLFKILEATPKQKPYMALAIDGQGRIVAHLLAIISYHHLLLPPFTYSHCHIYGEGVYAPEVDNKEEIFSLFVNAITNELTHKFCLFIEISDLKSKMFGYAKLRENGFFPIKWQKIHNSLHSKSPHERLSQKLRDKLTSVEQRGMKAEVVKPKSKELQQVVKLMRRYFILKPSRTIRSEQLFEHLVASKQCKIFATKYKDRVIGTCVCFFFGGNAYMWQLASRRKSYMMLYPTSYTIWSALKYAHEQGFNHMYFLDAGLPFKHNPIRECILNFGGKQVAEYRWFRIQIPWIGKFIDWLYNE